MTRMAMKPALVFVAIALSGAAAAAQPASQTTAPAAAPKTAGHWEGTLHMPGQEVPIAVDLAKNSSGAWTGSFGVPGSGQTGLPLGDITADDASIHFTLSVQEVATFEGKLSADAKSIVGSASNSQGSVGFELARNGEAKVNLPPPSSALPKEFEGRWEGAIDVGATKLHLAIRLSTGSDGKATGTLISIDQGGQEFPATSVTADGKQLSVEVRPIGGSYSGIMADNGEIVGNWSQGPMKVALTLKKADKP